MKVNLKNWAIGLLALLAMNAGFTACSDDDDDKGNSEEGTVATDIPSLYDPGDYARVSQITIDNKKKGTQVIYRFTYDKLGRIHKLSKQQEDETSEIIYTFFEDSVAVKTKTGVYGGRLNKDGYLFRLKYNHNECLFEYSKEGYLTGCTSGGHNFRMSWNTNHEQTGIQYGGTVMQTAAYTSNANNANVDFNALISNYAVYEYLLTQDVRLALFSFFGKRSPHLIGSEVYNGRKNYMMSYTVNEDGLPVKIVCEDHSQLNNTGTEIYHIVYE